MNLTPAELIQAARALLERADPTTAGLWPRATAFLTRQALEGALDALWARRAPGVEASSARAQLLCLPYYLRDDRQLARQVSYAWSALSWACHHHPYELPPTSSELLGWLGTVERLVRKVESL